LGTQVGFTAQAVAKVDPRLAAYYPTGSKRAGKPRSVQYDHVSVIAIAALQTEERQIRMLQREVRELKRAARHR
jgi:hypothetical protein